MLKDVRPGTAGAACGHVLRRGDGRFPYDQVRATQSQAPTQTWLMWKDAATNYHPPQPHIQTPGMDFRTHVKGQPATVETHTVSSANDSEKSRQKVCEFC